MSEWARYARTPNTVTGDLRVWPGLAGPGPAREREIYAWLPPQYAAHAADGRRYPVVYLHDGHALFDVHLHVATSGFDATDAAEWGVDETMTALHDEGLDAIVVGIPNSAERRHIEYTPACSFDPAMPAEATGYVDWVADVVKPLVDSSFATDPGREATVIGGSSLGGIVSLVGYRQRPEVFGAAGVFSPAFWYPGERMLAELETVPLPAGRIYLDIGGIESPEVPGRPQRYEVDARRAVAALEAQPQLDVRFVYEADGRHHERDWARRLPAAMRFLLSGQ